MSSKQKPLVEWAARVFRIEGKNDEDCRRDVKRCATSTVTALPFSADRKGSLRMKCRQSLADGKSRGYGMAAI